jgi:hypothetical protein
MFVIGAELKASLCSRRHPAPQELFVAINMGFIQAWLIEVNGSRWDQQTHGVNLLWCG